MITCEWAQNLSRYECRQVSGVHGESALEIGTPFSMLDGAAVVMYIVTQGSHLLISDNGDTLMHLSAMGLNVWHRASLNAIRERALIHGVTLTSEGDLRCLAQPDQAAFRFAQAISAVLAIGSWGVEQLKASGKPNDLAAEAEPYIIARNLSWDLRRNVLVKGASKTEYRFAFEHGPDLIDVIAPSAQGTGGVMRKIGDVINGPYVENLSPLVIVDDRDDKNRATQEIAIIGSLSRAMSFSDLMQPAGFAH